MVLRAMLLFRFFCFFAPLWGLFFSGRVLAQTHSFFDNKGADEVFNRLLTAPVIKARKIRCVTVETVIKRDGKRLRNTGVKRFYDFDSKGFPVSINEVMETSSADTSFLLFYSPASGSWIKRKSEHGYFITNYVFLDSLGRSLKTTICRETSEGQSAREFKPVIQYVLSKEEIKYTYQSIGKIKKSYFNEDGRLYKEGLLEM